MAFFSTDNPKVDTVGTPSLKVVIDAVTADATAKYVEPDQELEIYTDYTINHRYEKSRHTYMLPISSPSGFQGNSVAFVKLASEVLLWICDWTACRWSAPPTVPNSEPTDSNWILLDELMEPAMITVAADGVTPLYRLSGTYIYGHTNPDIALINDINFARPPWLLDEFDLKLKSDKFDSTLIDLKK